MRRGHEARLGRLWGGYQDVEREASDQRRLLRCYAGTYPLVREAMLRAGIDPESAPAMREVAAKLAAFVDTPEWRRIDAELQAAEEANPEAFLEDGVDPRDALNATLDAIGRRYRDSGRMPDFQRADFWHLLGWADPPDDSGAAEASLAGNPGEGSGA